jgi:nucleotide-binding universal stress UspA family protein
MSSEQTQVVVAYDFSHSAQAALYRAVALASRAPFHVLHFACILDRADTEHADLKRDQLASVIEQELRSAGTVGRVHFHIHVRISKHPAKEILEVARGVGADLIVVGSKGLTGLERVVLGSVSEQIVREAKCSVVIARPKDYPYVPLLDVVEIEAHPHQRPSHRYTYEDQRATLRPSDWPMY